MLSRLLTLAVAALAASTSSAEVSYNVIEGNVAAPVEINNNNTASAYAEMAVSIAAATSKSLIFTLASEINLVTQTAAKGENKGGKDTAEAYAGMSATIKYCADCEDEDASDVCITGDGAKIGGEDANPTVYEAAPGPITMSARQQTLSVDVDLDCTCEVTDLDCACEITGYVEVDLTLDTTAAHSFTWIAELRDTTGTGSNSKPIRAVACFALDADAQADYESSSSAAVTLGSTVFVATEAQPSKLREELP